MESKTISKPKALTKNIGKAEPYSEEYKEACFFAWYRAGRPGVRSDGGRAIVAVMPKDSKGQRPMSVTIKQWRDEYGWIERADAMDAQVSHVLENEAIQERVATLRQLAKDGKTLKEKGLNYLDSRDQPFEDNPSAAVRAIVAGSEMEFKYAGQAAVLASIGQMSDKQIQSEIRKLLGGQENDVEPEVIEAEEDEEVVLGDTLDEALD